MTLIHMNEYFENRGFTVNRTRDSKRDVYIFEISKNGRSLTGEYKWPQTTDWRLRDRDQHNFLCNLMREFYNQKWDEVTQEFNKAQQEVINFKNENMEENEMPVIWETNVLKTRSDAETVLRRALEILETYNYVSIADFADLCGVDANYKMANRGWSDLNGARVTRVRDGYVVELPEPRSISDIRYDTIYSKCIRKAETTPAIKDVIHNDPATIVFWMDGTKTVVKCQDGDIYDPEKGLAMAISKKVLGNQGNYYNTFAKWLPKEELVEEPISRLGALVTAGGHLLAAQAALGMGLIPDEQSVDTNRPLTKEEAVNLSVDGHKLWIKSLGAFLSEGDGWYGDVHENWSFSGYGSTWVAYRDMPADTEPTSEGSTNND